MEGKVPDTRKSLILAAEKRGGKWNIRPEDLQKKSGEGGNGGFEGNTGFINGSR